MEMNSKIILLFVFVVCVESRVGGGRGQNLIPDYDGQGWGSQGFFNYHQPLQQNNRFLPQSPHPVLSHDYDDSDSCNGPGSEDLSVAELCSLPPHKGSGVDDIFRYFYNPVVQLCIPFSYSGRGGNANRFVSVKNCYEICHPSNPSVKKPRVVSGIKAYLVPDLRATCPKKKRVRAPPREVVIRQMPHPLNARKTLTIIQNTRYIPHSPFTYPAHSSSSSGHENNNNNNNNNAHHSSHPSSNGGQQISNAHRQGGHTSDDRNALVLHQYETRPQYVKGGVGGGGTPPQYPSIRFG